MYQKKLLYKELSYQIQGAAMEVSKNYGSGHKEAIYQKALEEELDLRKVSFNKQEAIKIFSPKTGNLIGIYRPDIAVENKIIIEIKALENITKKMIFQIYDYLKNSKYELGYLINFGSEKLFTKRIIYTNDKKVLKGWWKLVNN